MTVPIRSALPPGVLPDAELVRCWHPGEPVGKGRPRCTCARGFPSLYTPTATRKAEADVGATLREAWSGPPTEGDVVVELLFSCGKRKFDADNLAKLVLDAAHGIVYANDRQVVGLYARRIVAPAPESIGTLVVVGKAVA